MLELALRYNVSFHIQLRGLKEEEKEKVAKLLRVVFFFKKQKGVFFHFLYSVV